jgi:hypothetical protein
MLSYVLVALGMATAAALAANLRREIRVQPRHGGRPIPAASPAAIPASPAPLPEPEPVFVQCAPRSGFNLNHRIQALRLLRRGEDAAHIAAALGIARSEVELLIRIQEIRNRNSLKAVGA